MIRLLEEFRLRDPAEGQDAFEAQSAYERFLEVEHQQSLPPYSLVGLLQISPGTDVRPLLAWPAITRRAPKA